MQLVHCSRVYNRCVEPKTCPDHQFYSQLVKVGGSEEGSDGSTLCNCCEVPTQKELALLRHPRHFDVLETIGESENITK